MQPIQTAQPRGKRGWPAMDLVTQVMGQSLVVSNSGHCIQEASPLCPPSAMPLRLHQSMRSETLNINGRHEGIGQGQQEKELIKSCVHRGLSQRDDMGMAPTSRLVPSFQGNHSEPRTTGRSRRLFAHASKKGTYSLPMAACKPLA